MKSSPARRQTSVLLATAFLASCPAVVRAATTDTWTGTTGNWSVASNWTTTASTHVVPQSGDTVNLTSTDGLSRTITFDPASASIATFTIDLTGGISGATETFAITNNNSLFASTEYVGYSGAGGTNGSGAVNQSNGTQSLINLYLGLNATDRGFYTLSCGSLTATEYIGYQGAGTFTQSGGNNSAGGGLFVGYLSTSTGTYTQSAGNLTLSSGFALGTVAGAQGTFTLSATGTIASTSDENIGAAGIGTFTQTGGANTFSGGNLNIGTTSNGNGTYALSNGTTSGALAVFVGGTSSSVGGRGNLTISGTGQFTTPGSLTVYNGFNSRVNLNGGSLSVGALNLFDNANNFLWSSGNLTWTGSTTIVVDNSAYTNLAVALALNPGQNLTSAAEEDVGYFGTGFVNQSGGNNTLQPSASLHVGNAPGSVGTYNLNSGSLNLNGGYEFIGDNGNATFNQSGGNNSLNTSGLLNIASGIGSIGAYNLSGGNLTLNSNAFIGGVGNGSFTQTGGTFTANNSGSIYLAFSPGSFGTFSLSGGTAAFSGQLFVGGTNFIPGGTGILNISGGSLSIGFGGIVVYNTPGCAINLSSGSLATPSLNLNGNPGLFHWTGGTLNLLNGISFDSAAGPTSTAAAFGAAYTLSNNQTLLSSNSETLGGTSKFALTLAPGGTNIVIGSTNITTGSTLFLNGGTFSGAAMLVSGTNARVVEQAPSTLSAANLTVSGNALFLANQGGVFTFTNVLTNGSSGAELSFDGDAAVTATTIDLGNNTLLAAGAASIAASTSITIEAGAELRGANPTSSILTTPVVQVSGLLDGSARLNARLQINSGGEVDVPASQSLTVTSTLSTNAGLVSLTGGSLHFTQGFTNNLAITGYGTLRVDAGLINNSSLALGGQPASLFGNITNNNTGFIGLAGNTTVFSNIINNGSIRLSGASANIFYGTIANPGSLSIDANATGIFYGPFSGNSPILNSGSLFINSGAVTGAVVGTGNLTLGAPLAPATMQITPASGASKLASLTLNATSQLDLTSNALVLQSANASLKSATIAQLAAEVLSGRNGNAWNGPGITSSSAAANPANISIAIADNAVLGYTSFQGQPVDANSILVVPAYFGDANLDGRVDLNDLNAVLNHLGVATGAWTNGNFDGAATIDLNDLNAVLNHLGVTFTPASSLATASSPLTPAATPEPASLGLIVSLLPLLLRRRSCPIR